MCDQEEKWDDVPSVSEDVKVDTKLRGTEEVCWKSNREMETRCRKGTLGTERWTKFLADL